MQPNFQQSIAMMSQELGPLIDNGTLKHENPLIDPSLSFGYGVSGTVEEPAEFTAPGCMIESASASARSLDPPSSTSQIQETHSDEYQRSSFEGCALSEPGPDLPGAEMPTVRTLRTSDPRNQLARPVFQRARSETSLITTERRPYGDRLDLSHAERPSVCRQWTSVTRKQMTRRAFQWTRSENPLLDPSPSLHGDIPDQPEKDEIPPVQRLRTSDRRSHMAGPAFHRVSTDTSLIVSERRLHGNRFDLSHAERPSVRRQRTSVTRKQMARPSFQQARSEKSLLVASPRLLHDGIPEHPEAAEMPLVRRQRRTSGTRMPLGRPRLVRASSDPYLNVSERRLAGDKPVQLEAEIPPVQRLRTSDRRSQMTGPAFHRVSTDTSLIVSERRLHGNRFDLSHAERPSVRRQRTRATRKQMALPSFQGARSEKCLLVSSPRLLHDGIPEHPEAAEMPLVRRQRRTSGTRMPLGRPRLVRASSDPYLNVSERRLAGDKPVQLEAELSTGRRRRGNSGTKMRMAPPELLRASSDPYLNVSDQRLEGDKPAQLEAELPIGRRWRRTGGIKMPVTPPGLRRTSSDPSLRVLALSGTSTPSTLAKDATMQAKGKRMSPTSTRRLGRAKSITSLVNQTCREEDFQHQVRDASGRRGLRKSDRENAGTSSGSKRAGDRRSKQSESSRMKRSSERSPISRRNHQREKRDTRHNREKQMSDCSLRVSDLVAEHATRVSSRRSKRAKDIPKTPAKKGVETRQDLAVEIAQRKEMLKTMMDEQSPEESWSRMIESWGSET